YFLFLRRETFFSVNRWFLLVSIGFSAFLPVMRIPFYTPQATILPEVTVTPYVNLLSSVTVYGAALSRGAEQFVLNYGLLGYVYLAGVVFFSGKFFLQLYQIVRLIAQSRVVPEGKIKLVILDKELSPFSFLNYIFVSKNLHNTRGWEKMLEHEKQHIRQGHTYDVLVLEVVAVFQWFNPFFWMFRRALRENHEFLADQAVILQGTAPSRYKQILINQYVGEQIVIANNFNYSLIKTRIKMISKIKSRKIANVKFLVGFVLAASLVAVFACEQKESVKTELTTSEKSVTLVADGHSVQITGDSAGIEKLKSIIAGSDDYDLTKDSVTGEMKLSSKGNKVGEIVAVAYGGVEKTAREEVYFIVEEMPEFPGGQLALRKFLAQQIKYPVVAQEKGIQGKVYVNFVVGKDGSVRNARIARGVDPSLDREALRVISSLPSWKPGKQKGKEVAVSYTVPISFVLE
ncbi:MAG: M56 family metallopeptidase, partial [Prolixibacteraceae bacterium]|nr:M56 family metallopeptidase [Prolixibacteraceae bacterium]